MAQIQKVTGINEGNTESGVVFETGSIGVYTNEGFEKKGQKELKMWKPIDSNVTNAKKCLGVEEI